MNAHNLCKLKRIWCLPLLSLTILGLSVQVEATTANYQAVPPFLAQKVAPNVLLVLDNSGSMNEFAYKDVTGERCDDIAAYTGYDEGREYYGLFNPDRTYKYNNAPGKHFFEPVGDVVDDGATTIKERAACLKSAPNELWSGNWLNWYTMRRIDVAKKVLTGGRIAPDSDDVSLEGMATERDWRRIYNDCAAGDSANGCVNGVATKNVYYTPFHQGFYSYWENINRGAIGGLATQFTTTFNFVTATFDVATDMTGDTCVDVPYTDLTQGLTVASERGDLAVNLNGSDYNGFVLALKIHADDLPVVGIIQNMANEVRFGYMQFNYGTGPGEGYVLNSSAGFWNIDGLGVNDLSWLYADGGKVRNPIADLVDEDGVIGTSDDPLYATDPAGKMVFQIVDNINRQNIEMNTPLQEVLWEAGRYFQQYSPGTSTALAPAFGGDSSPETPPANTVNFQVGTTWDPYFFHNIDNFDGTFGAYVPCARSFIIMVSDGAENNNKGVPTSDWPAGGNATFRDDLADATSFLEDIAFNLHTKDIRGDDTTSIFDEKSNLDQNITLYTVFAFEKNEQAKCNLMLAARAGGFKDLNNDGDIGNSINGGGIVSSTDSSAWESTVNGSLDREWDENGDNIPDTFFEASDGKEMEDAITEALLQILQQTASGTSLSVLSDKNSTGSVIYQALFFPNRTFEDSYKVDWVGALSAYWFYTGKTTSSIREDNNNPFFLDITADNEIDFRLDIFGDLKIDFYSLDKEGVRLALLGTYDNVNDINTIFESGEKLRDRAASTRIIYGVDKNKTQRLFTADNYASFDTNFGKTAYFPECLGTTSLGATAQTQARNLINYTRGAADNFTSANGSACRSRQVNSNPGSMTDGEGYRWKLGDIIHSSPTLVKYADRAVTYVASNDGMLHAFEAGQLRKDNLASDQQVRICEKLTGDCETANIGKEIWSFIPQNVMPYLRFMADPKYQHIYTHDLAPYFIDHGLPGNKRKIIIGGMRMGGGAGCTDGTKPCGDPAKNAQVIPPDFDPKNPASAHGLSSYYALDITNPDSPVFLWEFNHPDLGLTYSGPAYIKRGGNSYVMFTSGPLNYRGETQEPKSNLSSALKIFILKVDPTTFKLVDANGDGKIDANDTFRFVQKGTKDPGDVFTSSIASYSSTFGGRMFTDGVDLNVDGNTDAVFFGVNDANGTGGQVLAVAPQTYEDSVTKIKNHDPTNKINAGTKAETAIWNIDVVLNSDTSPVTTKIVYGKCFNTPFLYFGTGRWFYKEDSPSINPAKTEKLYGVNVRACIEDLMAGKNCSVNFANNSNDICKETESLTKETTMGWFVEGLEGLNLAEGYLKERSVTDASFFEGTNMVSFTTMQPSSKPCEFGGRTRTWVLNCLSGDSIWDGCPGYTIDVPYGSLLLQLSGGNIETIGLDKTDLSQMDNMASDWFLGIPPESAPPLVPPATVLTGEIILWIER